MMLAYFLLIFIFADVYFRLVLLFTDELTTTVAFRSNGKKHKAPDEFTSSSFSSVRLSVSQGSFILERTRFLRFLSIPNVNTQ